MKKLLIILSLFVLTGCAATSAWVNAQAACAADPKCLEQAKGYAKIGEAVASPWPYAAGGASAVITFVALGILGLKKKKDEPK